MTSLRQRMLEELRLRNLSETTTRLYIGSVKRFSQYFRQSPEQLGPEQIREFLLHLIGDCKSAPSTIQLYRSALRFLYVTMRGCPSRPLLAGACPSRPLLAAEE